MRHPCPERADRLLISPHLKYSLGCKMLCLFKTSTVLGIALLALLLCTLEKSMFSSLSPKGAVEAGRKKRGDRSVDIGGCKDRLRIQQNTFPELFHVKLQTGRKTVDELTTKNRACSLEPLTWEVQQAQSLLSFQMMLRAYLSKLA